MGGPFCVGAFAIALGVSAMLYYINNTVEGEPHGFSQDGSRFGPFGRAGAGCDAGRMRPQVIINGGEGKPLAELDQSGAPPHGLILLGPDKVQLRHGDKLAISVEGDAANAAQLRFTLKDGTLAILRESTSGTACRP
jgi:hypothetical protein